MSETLIADTLFQLGIILFAARLGGFIFERFKQPKVLGELLVGLIIGPSILGLLNLHDISIIFLAELGIIMLLFEVGLESNLHELLKSGVSSLLVAIIGVAAPVILAMPYLFAIGLDFNVAFFIAATLTATSVGLTMRVLGDMNMISSIEGKIILGAAVIDDIIGLIILSILTDMVSVGTVDLFNVGKIIAFSIVFLVVTVLAGKFLEGRVINAIHHFKIQRTFIVMAFIFALLMSYLAAGIGLATIVGAFAAGLVLEREEHKEHIWKNTHVLTQIFAPVFFVVAGASVDLFSLIKPEIIPMIVILSLVAVVGKLVSGLGAFREKASKISIGVGMIPRGEVGLIFASFGLSKGLVSGDIYSALVAVIMITTFITPPLLTYFLQKKYAKETVA
ncbi:MAG: cation:proton antiporter [archaeon]|nr:cation:proton antiporter [archaeon]